MTKQNLVRGTTAVLIALPAAAYGHGISEAERQRMLEGGYLQYVELGATHMLTGYDHLLFLFGVVFFLSTFKDVAKLVTVFTLGHCITLIFATFYRITWNFYVVEAIIALSVIYRGFDNNGGFQKYLDMKSPNLLAAVFVFGLIHGFGLSTRLQELPLGDDAKGMLLRILSFNLGVEIGQIIASMVMIGALTVLRRRPSFARFSYVANWGLIYAGVLLLLMHLHGYHHDIDANNLRFPSQAHEHAHEDMDIERSADPSRNKI